MAGFDLIIVGAGPAGTSAAASASRAGLSVLLLDRERFPREKPCGGGVPASIQAAMPEIDLGPVIEQTTRFMRHTYRLKGGIIGAVQTPGAPADLRIHMVRRPAFDALLLEHAVKGGAQFRPECRVLGLEPVAGGVRVHFQDRESGLRHAETGHQVLGADGANGVVARLAGLRKKRHLAFALELDLPCRFGTGRDGISPEILHLDYGLVPGGYAWAFPKAGAMNIGAVICFLDLFRRKSARAPREVLEEAIRAYAGQFGIENPSPCAFRGYPLPVWSGKEALQTHDSRIFLAGDAAGLINPFYGDGILNAVRSGLLFSDCLRRGEASTYTTRIHGLFGENFDNAWRVARLFYRWPRPGFRFLVRRPEATPFAARLLAGETSLAGFWDKLWSRLPGMFGQGH